MMLNEKKTRPVTGKSCVLRAGAETIGRYFLFDFRFLYMYYIELGKCKRLTPSTSKSVDSFRSYDTLKTGCQNLNRKIRFFLSSFLDGAALEIST